MDQINPQNEIDKKLKHKKYQKEYQKQYRELNKDKIKNYESKKPSKIQTERVKKCVTKNSQILKIIKKAISENTLMITNEEDFNNLKIVLNSK